MKKIILVTLISFGLANAADTTILTKATIKLIKNQDKVIGDLLDIRASLRNVKRTLKKQISKNKQIQTNTQKIGSLEDNVSIASFQIQKLNKKISELKKTIQENNNSINGKFKQINNKMTAQAKDFEYATKGLTQKIKKIELERYIKYSESNCTLYRVSSEVENTIDSYLK